MYIVHAPTARVAQIRDRYRNTRPKVCTARMRIVTEYYQNHPEQTGILKRAGNLKNLLEKIPVPIHEGEIIVGSMASTYRGSALFPENDISWFRKDYEEGHFLNSRSLDPYDIDPEDVDYILSVSPYWEKNSLMAQVAACMPSGYVPHIGNGVLTYGKEIANTPVGHFCGGYDRAVRVGFRSVRDEARAKAEALEDRMLGDSADRYYFYRAVEMVCEGMMTFAERYADEAARQAAECGNAARRKELQETEASLRRIASGHCETFQDAVQCVFLYHLGLCLDCNMHGITLGRIDQYLGSFYEADLRAGRITSGRAQEIMDLFYLKIAEMNKVWSFRSTQTVSGYTSGMLMTLGGVDRDGRDATNPVTYMMLQASGALVLHDPPQSLRIHKGTPPELWEAAIRTTMIAGGVPTFENDDIIIPSLLKRGMSLESARNYCLIGCVEPGGTGNEWSASGGSGAGTFWLMPNAFLQAINNGCNPMPGPNGKAGGQTGLTTGYLFEMETFEEVLAAVKKQFKYFLDWQASLINSFEYIAAEQMPQPLVSAMMDGCMESGKDVMRGGARFNSCGTTGVGIGNLADCLAVTKYLCYDKKICTTRQLYDAIMSNWSAPYEELRQYIKTEVPHYGNDNPYCDQYAKWVSDLFADLVTDNTGPRCRYAAGLWPVATNVVFGKITAATPDGRAAGDALSDGISPVQQMDINGPTAVLKSVSQIEQTQFSNGTLLNMKFHPTALAGEEGQKKLRSLILTYFDLGGMEMQFNVVSAETLRKAQREPENYRDLIVRVAGFSAYFVELTEGSQNDVIRRTEMNL